MAQKLSAVTFFLCTWIQYTHFVTTCTRNATCWKHFFIFLSKIIWHWYNSLFLNNSIFNLSCLLVTLLNATCDHTLLKSWNRLKTRKKKEIVFHSQESTHSLVFYQAAWNCCGGHRKTCTSSTAMHYLLNHLFKVQFLFVIKSVTTNSGNNVCYFCRMLKILFPNIYP